MSGKEKGACDFKELFPSKTSFIVFISYMGLFINQGDDYILILLIHSQLINSRLIGYIDKN